MYKLKIGEVISTTPTIGFIVETLAYMKVKCMSCLQAQIVQSSPAHSRVTLLNRMRRKSTDIVGECFLVVKF